MARISGWVFVGIGFLVVAVSIFMYDELRFFIFLGGIMTLYGLGKLAIAKFEQKWQKAEDDGPVHLDERQNPYLHGQQQGNQHARGHRQQHHGQRTHHQKPHPQQKQVAHNRQHRAVQQRQPQRKYCPHCGYQMAREHRFCSHCGGQS